MGFLGEYLFHLTLGLIPLSMGTLLIVLSGFLERSNKKLRRYSFLMGLIISLFSLAPVILNFLGALGQIF